MAPANKSVCSFVTPCPTRPLRLVSTLFRSDDHNRQGRPGWHDLLIMSLDAVGLERLLRAYDYAKEVRSEMLARGIIVRDSDRPARIELPAAIQVSLHSSSCADGSGWELIDSDPWSALPLAFDDGLLGSANPGCSDEANLEPVLQLYERHDTAMLRVHTNLSDNLPEFFQTEELPIDDLRHWQRHHRWTGSLVLRDGVNYAGH